MVKRVVITPARIAFGGWLFLLALFAMGSLLATPWPFVIMGFSLGGLPYWISLRRFSTVIVSVLLAVVVTAVPIILLLDYGASEGGISGAGETVQWTTALSVASYCFVWLGLGTGRLVWQRRIA